MRSVTSVEIDERSNVVDHTPPDVYNAFSRNRVFTTIDPEEKITEEAHQDEVNINRIMARYQKTPANKNHIA